ncbi:kinase-like domain-containing protein [Mycena galopus ATCC 62051]|nr:kinase-like domain-containing protein [Mycena galopus ATCC 62051]
MSYRTDRVRLIVLFARKSNLSKEEFHKYWLETHGPLFSSLDAVKNNLLKYEQGHVNGTVVQQLAQMMGAPVTEWNGMAIFEGESLAKIFEVFQSEQYQKIIVPDEENFIDRTKFQMIPLIYTLLWMYCGTWPHRINGQTDSFIEEAYLATTPFASHTVTLLTGGTANFAFRLHLLTLHKGQTNAGTQACEIIRCHQPLHFIGHRKTSEWPCVREMAVHAGILHVSTKGVSDHKIQAFEAKALQKIKEGLDCGPLAIVPMMYHFDETAHILIMEDCGQDSQNLKALMIGSPPSPGVAQEIGRALGQFLGRLHSWAAIDPKMVDFFDQNEQAKRITAWVTYGRIIDSLTTDNLPAVALLPEPVPASDLDDIRAIIAERTPEIFNCRDTLTMGDFWPGNIMVNLRADGSFGGVHVIDWELAKAGVAALDVGQFCAEMLSLILFKPPAVEAAKALVEAFLTEYRVHCGVMAPHFANVAAKHIGAHLVTITPRVDWGTPEETESGGGGAGAFNGRVFRSLGS